MKFLLSFTFVLSLISSLAFGESKCTNFSGNWKGMCIATDQVFGGEDHQNCSISIEQDNCEQIKINNETWYLDGRTSTFHLPDGHTDTFHLPEGRRTEVKPEKIKIRDMEWNRNKTELINSLIFDYSEIRHGYKDSHLGNFKIVNGELIYVAVETSIVTFTSLGGGFKPLTTLINCNYKKQQ